MKFGGDVCWAMEKVVTCLLSGFELGYWGSFE